jgi:hypothetical protein
MHPALGAFTPPLIGRVGRPEPASHLLYHIYKQGMAGMPF